MGTKRSNFATYEIEEALTSEGYKYIVGLDEVGRGCELPDAEILTEVGWKYYYNLTLNDRVLSYTNNDTLVWQPINKIIEKDHDGNILHLSNRSVNIKVTPDHYFDILRRTFKRDKLDNNRLKLTGYVFNGRKSVLELKNNDFIPCGGRWIGDNHDYFILPSIEKLKYDNSHKDYTEKIISLDVWLAFIGIYLSEGCCTHSINHAYVIKIAQKKKDTYNKIYELCRKLPFEVFKESDGIVIRNKQLYMYLNTLGKCYDKYIPINLKNLPSDKLNILIRWLILGDGSCYKSKERQEVCTYYTTSKKLRNDIEEILIKAGWTYKTNIRQPRDGRIQDRCIKKENRRLCYEIRLRRNNKIAVKHLHKALFYYSGKVFCLSLPTHHNFYVRRSGSGYFTGNCGAGPVVAAAVRIPISYISSLSDVKDSKKLSSSKREHLYEKIVNLCDYGIGVVNNHIIDEINILEATKLAMKKALAQIDYVDYVIIDGNIILKGINLQQKFVIRGDALSISIAAGSILAKVTRDRMMLELHKIHPVYSWDKNKGYLTKKHIDAINTYGITEYHRESFAKIKDRL